MQEFIKKSKDIVLGYLNMTDKSPDEVYTQAEKDFLNYILDVINKNRFPFKTK